MPDDKKRKTFDDMKADARKAAREQLGLVESMKRAPRRASALSRAAGRVRDKAVPPPPGFVIEP